MTKANLGQVRDWMVDQNSVGQGENRSEILGVGGMLFNWVLVIVYRYW